MLVVIVFCLCLSIFLAACSRIESTDEIVIGAAWPFAADETGQFEKGIDLAVSEINDVGGIGGRKITLLKADDGAEIVGGLAVAKQLSENSSVLAVIGHRSSFISIPASAVYEQAGVVMLSPASTTSKLTQNGYTFTFRNLPNDDQIARSLVEYASERELHKMVIFFSDDTYGIGLAEALEDQAKPQGIAIIDRFYFYAGEPELKRMLDKWEAFDFDGIFIASSMTEGIQFIIDARNIGIDCPFLSGNALDSSALALEGGKFAEGTIVGSVFDPGDSRSEVQGFVEAFRKAYGEVPDAKAALAYDAVWMLAAAAERANELSRASIAEELHGLGEWTGICGTHVLRDTGDDLGDLVVIKELWNGNFIVPNR